MEHGLITFGTVSLTIFRLGLVWSSRKWVVVQLLYCTTIPMWIADIHLLIIVQKPFKFETQEQAFKK